jgi:hypothetical protein
MNTIPVRPLLMLKLTTLAAFALLMLLLSGCHLAGVKGNGRITTEARPITEFTELETDGAFEVTWAPGGAAFSVTTDENLIRYIHTRLSGQKLVIEWMKPLRATRGIKVQIASSQLIRATLNGAMRLAAASLSGRELYLEANGASRVTLNGNVNAVQAEMNGASRLDAESLATRAMDLTINGAGRAEVNVAEVLKVDISGAGRVTYSGNPTIDKSISGAGSVKKRD